MWGPINTYTYFYWAYSASMLYRAELVNLGSFSNWFFILFRLSRVGEIEQERQKWRKAGRRKGWRERDYLYPQTYTAIYVVLQAMSS
jgi:hypothetical protein